VWQAIVPAGGLSGRRSALAIYRVKSKTQMGRHSACGGLQPAFLVRDEDFEEAG